jgi:hypothetical protein
MQGPLLLHCGGRGRGGLAATAQRARSARGGPKVDYDSAGRAPARGGGLIGVGFVVRGRR